MRERLFVIALSLSLLASSTSAPAQTLDRGEINGTVRDESGAVLANVDVSLREADTGLERTTSTNGSGHYNAVLLPLGVYHVSARLSGFAVVRAEPVVLRLGQALVVDFVLPVAAVTAAVDVRATAADEAAAGSRLVITGASATNLPSGNRDYRDFALLAPTAQATTGTRGTFRLAGQPGDYLALNVDGLDFTNNFYGEFFGSLETRNATVPLEAIREFQVSAAGFGTEFGRSNGGLVHVVTKSGTNSVHGSAAYFLRHHALTADDAFGNPPSGMIRHQFGGSIGGPLRVNRTFYFLATDLQSQETPLTIRFSRDIQGVSAPELGIADLGALQGQYPRDESLSTLLAKLDHAVGFNHRLSARTSFTRNHGTNIAGGSLILARAPANLETFTNQGVSTVLGLSSSLSPRAFSEARFQFAREVRPRESQGEGPQVVISDTGTFGRSQVLPSTQDMYRYQASTNLTYVRGNHTLKIGGDYNAFNMRNNLFATAINGAYTFPTLERFLARQPSLYSQFFGLGGTTASEAARLESFWQSEVAAYFQDRLQLSPRMTISYGIRYDAQFNPSPLAPTAGVSVPLGPPRRRGNTVEQDLGPVPQDIPDDTNNFAPRAEASYDLTDSGRTFLKAATGLYYGRTPMIYFPIRGSGVTSTTIVATPAAFGVTFPQVLPSEIAPGSSLERLVPRPSIQYVDPSFQNPRVLNVNASLTHQVTPELTVEAGVLFSDSRHLRVGGFRSTTWDRNLNPPTTFDEFGRGVGVLAGGRPDSTIGQANTLSSFGRGRYRALVLAVHKPFSRAWQLDANYVLSTSKGNGSTERDTEALMGPSDPFDPTADYGVNELDQRHAFKAHLIRTLPGDLSVSSIVSAGSGLAFPVYSPVDVNGDGVTNGGLHPDRPDVDGRLLPRFPFHQPAWLLWDLRLAKLFPIAGARYQLVLDAFNVLGLKNTYSDPRTNAVLGRPNFRERNRTLGPRLVQLGLRVDF